VIAYVSRKLRRHEENYEVHVLELLAIVYGLKVWRHYLFGKKFELKIDHCGLQLIFMQNDLNTWQGHWSEILSEYNCVITYIKGTMKRVVDVFESETMNISGDTSVDESSWKDSNFTTQ
jgi:hypothetical protein